MAKPTKAKREAFNAKLDAFLEDFIEQPAEGGYPIVTDVTLRALDDVIRGLLDLKFQRDEDNAMVIEVALGNRKKSKLVHFSIPHSPRDDSIESEVQYIAQLARAADSASYYAKDATKMLEFHTMELADRMKRKNKLKEDVESVRVLLDAKDLKGAQDRLQELYREYDKDGAKHLLEDGDDWSGYWRVPEELLELLGPLSKLVPDSVKLDAYNKLTALLDQTEEVVGEANHGWDKKVGELGLRRLFNDYKFSIGNKSIAACIKRYNEQSSDDRAIRALLKRGVKVELAAVA